MENYKVILADDETEVLNSIRKNIRWKELGFEITGAVFNGKDVMDLLESQEADLLITDIRMPFMDGMELLKKVRTKYPQMKMVIISGYDDFQYAKEAMTYDVTDYLLKPIHAEEMEEALRRIRRTLEREMEEKKNVHILEKQYIANLPIIRENLLNRLITGSVMAETLEEELDNCAVGIARSRFWAVALLQIAKIESGGDKEPIDQQLGTVYIRSLVKEKCRECSAYALFYTMLGECIIFGMRKKDEMERILFCLGELTRESRRVMGIHVAVGVGKVKEEILECRESFQEAKEALLYRRITGDVNVVYMEDIDVSSHVVQTFDQEIVESLFSAVKFGCQAEILEEMGRIREQITGGTMRRTGYQACCISILNHLVLLMQQQRIEAEEIFGGVPDYLNILMRYDRPEEFLNWIEDSCLKIGKICSGKRDNKAKTIVEIAQEQIAKGYGDPEISLEKVASGVGLTATYFSSLFKKETGESFVEYLTRVRMEEAMRRLKETDEKIYLIAEQTGYPDPGYFSHVFKKRFGISPVQCRRGQKK